ncbi:MAG: MATE family efflux transporter [Spirochaetales bacterium]|nr:MATE family efflux transporter [Spirochaetales bacterium]
MSDDIKINEIDGMFKGPIRPLLMKLAIPMFAGMVVQVVYNVTDTFWVARIDMADPSYMGGTAIVFPLIFFFMALGNGLSVGVSSLVARAIGEKNAKVLSTTAESGLLISLILSVLSLVIILPFGSKILVALGAQGDYYVHGLEYLNYIVPAGPVIFFTMIFLGILQGEGLMKYVMNSMLIGTVLNIVLDPVFIFILDMNVKGAAIATVLAQVVGLIYVVTVFSRNKSSIKIEWAISNIKGKTIKDILAIGIPQSLAMIIMSLSFVILNKIVIEIDALALTAFALCGRFEQLMLMPAFAIGAAIVTIVGQNAARGNYERVTNVMKESWLIGAISVGILTGLMVGFAPWIFKPFTDVEKVRWYAVMQYRVLGISYLTALFGITGRSFFQAIGYPLPALFLTLLRLILIAIPVMLILIYVFNMGIWGVWLGLASGSVVSMIISVIWVRHSIKRLESGKMKIHGV